ncbi:hypothetical protein Tco_0920927, partial [Tanacetum coccineum]
FKERESKSIDKEIVLEKRKKWKTLSWIKPILYDGNVLSKTHDVLSMDDDEETLILAEESKLKMIERKNDPIMKKEKINITLINYSELNKLAEDFGKRFSEQELSAEQKFWLQSSDKNSEEPSTSNTPIKIKVPSELPKVSLVNKILKKLRFHLASFDKVVKVRTTPDAITEGRLLDEITKVQTVFTQIETVVEQCSVDRKCCEIQQKQFLIENDRVLDKIISQEIVNIVLHSSVVSCDSEKKNEDYVGTCNKCLELEAELVKKNDVYNKLSKRCSNLEKHYISIEVAMQLNQEIFQKDKSCVNQNAPEIQEYFKQNDLKAQLQAKDTVIDKLKEIIHSLRENTNHARVKQDMDEIETINIELQHSVAKLLSENELLHKEIKHLKKIYKYQFDSIKKTCASSKEHNDTLIIQLNSKSMENADLKGMFKLDIEPISHRLKNNRDAHEDYLKKTIENTDTIRGLVNALENKILVNLF